MDNNKYKQIEFLLKSQTVFKGTIEVPISIANDKEKCLEYIYDTENENAAYDVQLDCGKKIIELINNDIEEDSVNHPNHYNTGKIEVIDFIEDQNLGFHLGNAIKYICRCGKKDPTKIIEDIKKAIWYLERFIKMKK